MPNRRPTPKLASCKQMASRRLDQLLDAMKSDDGRRGGGGGGGGGAEVEAEAEAEWGGGGGGGDDDGVTYAGRSSEVLQAPCRRI